MPTIVLTGGRIDQLDELREPGQSYDNVIKELIQSHNRGELARKAREASPEEYVPLDGDGGGKPARE